MSISKIGQSEFGFCAYKSLVKWILFSINWLCKRGLTIIHELEKYNPHGNMFTKRKCLALKTCHLPPASKILIHCLTMQTFVILAFCPVQNGLIAWNRCGHWMKYDSQRSDRAATIQEHILLKYMWVCRLWSCNCVWLHDGRYWGSKQTC